MRDFDETFAKVEVIGPPWPGSEQFPRADPQNLLAGFACEVCGEFVTGDVQGIVLRGAQVFEPGCAEPAFADVWLHRFCYFDREDGPSSDGP